ncbi:unnamed protein product [Microthlaspi erraticum]|uniref:Arabidopsis retrotransposon Orf1 C-terminal domain-containing protein n=1 Tax=Microthlaspi erraticum TaxID=1685480 RepID=A0A6D2IY11_9BRAS|nr:unnamed protein product [Microthlaspi erraticum]
MDTQTLDLLKIRDDVTWYIRKLGLSKLFKLECSDANGRISISALCQLFGLPNETAHDFKENSKRKQAAFADWTHFANEPFLPSRSKVSRITHPAIRYVHRLISTTFQCKQEANKTFINVRKLAKDLEGNKKLCVRFGRLITAIVQHVGIDIPNYEPLPKPTPLDLHALQHIHFLNRWTKDPTRFCRSLASAGHEKGIYVGFAAGEFECAHAVAPPQPEERGEVLEIEGGKREGGDHLELQPNIDLLESLISGVANQEEGLARLKDLE